MDPRPAKATRAEAGRKGGLATKHRHGEDFFGKIGRMGGRKGGRTTLERYGKEFFREIGAQGGAAPHPPRKASRG
jgi:general stress protein YciG